MKSSILLYSAMIVSATCLLSGCQKEISTNPNIYEDAVIAKQKKEVTHIFKGDLKATYRAIPGLNSQNIPGIYYPGSGKGNLTFLGKIIGYVNMFVTGTPPANLQGSPASILPYFGTELAQLGITTLPQEVSILFADAQGNTVWATGTGAGLGVQVLSPTKATFSGNAVIVGGTGKYENATGLFVFSGWFNPQDWNDAYGEVSEGVISLRKD